MGEWVAVIIHGPHPLALCHILKGVCLQMICAGRVGVPVCPAAWPILAAFRGRS